MQTSLTKNPNKTSPKTKDYRRDKFLARDKAIQLLLKDGFNQLKLNHKYLKKVYQEKLSLINSGIIPDINIRMTKYALEEMQSEGILSEAQVIDNQVINTQTNLNPSKFELQMAKIALDSWYDNTSLIKERVHVNQFHRTCKCGKHRISDVSLILKNTEAHFKGLVTCGSVWACPVCAAKIQEKRRKEIKQAFEWSYKSRIKTAHMTITFDKVNDKEIIKGLKKKLESDELYVDLLKGKSFKDIGISTKVFGSIQTSRPTKDGWTIKAVMRQETNIEQLQKDIQNLIDTHISLFRYKSKVNIRLAKDNHRLKPIMITYTVPHKRNDDLPELLSNIRAAQRDYKSGDNYRRIRCKVGYIGSIRTHEITYGINGWHPHTHELWFVDSQTDTEELHAVLTERWFNKCNDHGLIPENRTKSFREVAVHIKDNCKDSDYLAKQNSQAYWGVDREIAKSTSKVNTSQLQTNLKGISPFQLLGESEKDIKSGKLFVEYCNTMKGQRQLYWSAGLKGIVGLNEVSDEELTKDSDDLDNPNIQKVMDISPEQWKLLVKYKLRLNVLELTEDKNYHGIKRLFAKHNIPEPVFYYRQCSSRFCEYPKDAGALKKLIKPHIQPPEISENWSVIIDTWPKEPDKETFNIDDLLLTKANIQTTLKRSSIKVASIVK